MLAELGLPPLVRCLRLLAGLNQAASMDQAQCTQWAGGCFLGQVDFLSRELCLAVGVILAFSLQLEPGMGSICFLITHEIKFSHLDWHAGWICARNLVTFPATPHEALLSVSGATLLDVPCRRGAVVTLEALLMLP